MLAKAQKQKTIAIQYDLRPYGGPLATVEGSRVFIEFKGVEKPQIWRRDATGRWEEEEASDVSKLSRAMSVGHHRDNIHPGNLEFLYKKYLNDVILIGSDDKQQPAKVESLARKGKRGAARGVPVPEQTDDVRPDQGTVGERGGAVHAEPRRDVAEDRRELLDQEPPSERSVYEAGHGAAVQPVPGTADPR